MRVNLVRCFAALMGLTAVSTAYAEFGQNSQGQYVAPKKWSHFKSDAPTGNAPNLVPVPSAQVQHRVVETQVQPPPSMEEPDSVAEGSRFYQERRQTTSTPARPMATYAEYKAPSAKSTMVRPVSNASAPSAQPLPAPAARPHYSQPEQLVTPHPTPVMDGATDGYSVFEHTPPPSSSCYADAVAAPWEDFPGVTGGNCGTGLACGPQRLPLSPWFAGGNVLLWNFENDGYRRFLIRDGMPRSTEFSTDTVSPDFATGFDVYFGRYFDCGRYGLSVNYLSFNPGQEENVSTMPSYSAMPHWEQVSVDHDGVGGAQSVYDIYDNADAFRVRRDINVQGLELTLSCFGLSGARRLAPACGTGLGKGPLAGLKRAMGLGCGHGHTYAGGPLERPCFGTTQLVTSHGFRWFQFEDEFQFASSDANDGFNGPSDMFYDSNVTNDLYGYQFGSQLIYCLGCRWTANFGGKAGLYGNDVFVQQQLGTPTSNAYVTTTNEMINTSDRDVVLAGLGEIDLGLGYRICNGWTLNGGYRMLYASGVATSVGSIPSDYYSVGPSAHAYADDGLLLHGAYFGTSINW